MQIAAIVFVEPQFFKKPIALSKKLNMSAIAFAGT